MFEKLKEHIKNLTCNKVVDFPDESYFATRYTLAEVALAIAEDTKKPFRETLQYLQKIVRCK